jgi:hypothetical protein
MAEAGCIKDGSNFAITANTSKVGITPAQAEQIQGNTEKVGITTSQASELSQNTINITALDNNKANKAGGNIFTGNQQLTGANYDIVTSGEYRKDGTNILTPYRTSAASDTLLNAKANDNAVVKLTGAQTISGVKTFDGGVSMPNLPTSDPADAGALYISSGTLKISSG